ncbi:MAG: 3-ketoacyl-ACP reductase [Candidatus Hydrogenedentes bacterium]|nr:3-ketoacyl-ACP reductase [Candidatus Hydrogenedentota bacterium]
MGSDEKRVALVTGAGQGIGRGIALRLAQAGHHVVINDVVADEAVTDRGAYEVKRTIEAAGGGADVFRADIASRDERAAMVEFVADRFGRLDLLVNNAGVAPKERKDLLEATEQSFERLMSINLEGPYFLTQLVANRMIAWKRDGVVEAPRIVFISSISAYTSSPARGEYCVSKAGVSMAAQLYADRLGEYGIPVLEVSPGIIETPMTSVVKDKYDKLIAEGLLVTKRWGVPDDVAGVVAAFAAGHLDYSTGQRIEVGGGFGLRRL